jgi:uncharacterized membrane protein
MLNKEWFSIIVIVIMFVLAFYFQVIIPHTGGVIVTSMDTDGTPLQTGSRFANLFAMPILALAVYLLMNSLPSIAVHKRNIEKFYQKFYGFKAILLLFLLVVYLVNLMPALGFTFESIYILIPALGLLFIYLGHVLKHIHRNYFIGLLSPWALSSDKLWDKTHKFGGAVLEVAGIFMFLALIFQDFVLEIILAALIISVMISTVYSYLIFTRSHHHR